MPIGTPFHSRTAPLCVSYSWRTWSGYLAASSYAVVHDYEYHAIRNSAGLIDVSPLFKYDVRGKDALRLVNRVATRDAAKCAVGQAIYTCLCDDDGYVIQDGTIFRLDQSHFRFNLAEPALRWLCLNAVGLDATVEEVSERIAALALQGPNSRNILQRVIDVDLAPVRFFRVVPARLAGYDVVVSRTGYTGDLGYEIWLPASAAEPIWDVITAEGADFSLKPAGLLALDVARLEAGFVLLDVDYVSAERALIPSQRYTPFEIGLGWTVDLNKEFFVGAKELRNGRQNAERRLAGIEVDLRDFDALFRQAGLPPALPLTAWRSSVPIFHQSAQIGYATTGGWSPLLQKYIALATIESKFAEVGSRLQIEIAVEHTRKTATCRIVPLPFFDPPRKKAVDAAVRS